MEAATGAEWSDGQKRRRRRNFIIIIFLGNQRIFFSSRVIDQSWTFSSRRALLSCPLRPVWELDELQDREIDGYIHTYTVRGSLLFIHLYTHPYGAEKRVWALSLLLYIYTQVHSSKHQFSAALHSILILETASSSLSVLLSKHFSPEWTHTFHLTLGSRVLLLLSDLFFLRLYYFSIHDFLFFWLGRLYHSNYADGGFFLFLSSDSVFTTTFSLLCFDVGWQPATLINVTTIGLPRCHYNTVIIVIDSWPWWWPVRPVNTFDFMFNSIDPLHTFSE